MEQKMSRVSLQNGGGPGSSISMAPETIKVRNALIEKFTGEPLDEMNHFMNTALATETNELRRIGILAARIFLLRTRIANLQDFNRDPSLTDIPEINVGALDLASANIDAADDGDDDDDVTEIEDGWARLKMISSGEVQGVRFLSGAIIDAKPEDAEKLIQSGKAIRVDENGGSEASDSDNAHAGENMSSTMTDEQIAKAENDEQPLMAAADDATADDANIADSAETKQPNPAADEVSDNADDET